MVARYLRRTRRFIPARSPRALLSRDFFGKRRIHGTPTVSLDVAEQSRRAVPLVVPARIVSYWVEADPFDSLSGNTSGLVPFSYTVDGEQHMGGLSGGSSIFQVTLQAPDNTSTDPINPPIEIVLLDDANYDLGPISTATIQLVNDDLAP